jgi:hypothetical protein
MGEGMNEFRCGVEPQFAHWQVIDEGGKIIRENEQHNLVLNRAKDDLLAQYGYLLLTGFAVVGSGSTAPVSTQTGLQTEVARTGSKPANTSDETLQVTPGVYDIVRVRQFDAAQLAGRNLTEWGFSPVNVPGANLAVRELFRDAQGTPITLTMNPGQTLRIIHKTRVTLNPLNVVNTSLNITGLGNRAGKLYLKDGSQDLWAIDALISGRYLACGIIYNNDAVQYSGPSALSDSKGLTLQPYVSGSKLRQTQPVTWNANEAIRTIWGLAIHRSVEAVNNYYGNSSGGLCLKFDAGQEFTKDNEHSLTLGAWGVSW